MDATADTTLDPLREYRSWGSVLFGLLAALGLIGGAIVIQTTLPPMSLLLLVTVAGSVLIYSVVSFAIGRRDPWALHAIAPLCVLIILFGLVRAAVALGQNQIMLPLEALGAIAVLSRDHRPELMPVLTDGGRRRVWLAVGGLVLTQLSPYIAEPALRGDLLAAGADDITLTATVDCHGADQPGTPIVATVSWSWRGERPFAPPDDGVVVRWSVAGDDSPPDAGLTVTAQRVSDEATIRMGSAAGPDAVLDGFRRAGLPFVDFAISRSGSALQDGSIGLELVPNDPSSSGGTVDLQAAYAHGDRWVRKSGLAVCSW